MRTTFRWPALLAVALPALGAALLLGRGSQADGEDRLAESTEMEMIQAYLIDAFERAKAMDVEFAAAIPDSALRWAPNDEVRDFAEQIAHTANNGFIADAVFGESAPELAAEDDALLNDGQALAAAIGEAYDWILERLRAMPADDLAKEVDFFGRPMTRWTVCTFALEHAWWTRGQMVPYFRAHGMAPPRPRM